MPISTFLESPPKTPLPSLKPEHELGAEGRLGISIRISDHTLSDDYHREMFLVSTRLKLRQQLGLEIFNHIVIRPNPVRVRIVERLERQDWDHSFTLSYIAELQNVEMIKNFMLEMPPFEFMSYGSLIPVIEWQCMYCGQTNLVKDNLECRKCSAPRKPIR